VAQVQEKTGGPYSKNEREKRQKEVHRLHFEFGYPATKIAELMKINRNTINEDIKYWYSNFKEDLKQNSEDFILRQIGRLEAQRTRIIENITENKIDDMKHEKLLLDMDKEIDKMVIRINSAQQIESKPVEIQEEVIKDIILFLIIKHSRDYSLKKEDIVSEIVNLQQCTMTQAGAVLTQIEELGLECCRKFRSHEFVYDLLEFAYLRRYVLPNDEFIVKINALYILDIHIEAKKVSLGKRYSEKYGKKEKWTDEVFTKYHEDKNKEMKKYAETESKMIVEALESLSNQEQVEDYLKYIDVIFGKKEKDRFDEI